MARHLRVPFCSHASERQSGRKWWGENEPMRPPRRHVPPSELREILSEMSAVGENELELIISAIPILAWSARPDGYIEFLNHRWFDYTGMTAEEATGWGWTKAVYPVD